MSERPRRDDADTCAYCGTPIRGGRTCSQHRDLERLDPHLEAERPPAGEAELGVRPWYRMSAVRRRRRP